MKSLLSRISFVTIAALALAGCGVESDSHYNQDDKTFGHDKPPPRPTIQALAPTPQSTTAPAVATATPTPTATPIVPTPTPDPVPTEPDEPPPSSGHDVLSRESFSGYFNSKALRRIVKGTGDEATFSDMRSFAEQGFTFLFKKLTADESNEKLDMLVREDGDVRQIVSQTVSTAGGDKVAKTNGQKETKSGMQQLFWMLGGQGDCPRVFVCVDKIQWTPKEGQSWTYCFKDLKTDGPISVPYAPNPNFGPGSFKSAIPEGSILSKPFYMTRHPGLVACDDTRILTLARDLIQWRVAIGNLNDTRSPDFFRKATHTPLVPDTEIQVEYSLYSEKLQRGYLPPQGPYLNDISRFNRKSRYFLDSKEHALAKITLTMQTSFDSVLPGLRDSSGLEVEYTQEFCKHVDDNAPQLNHCTGKME